MTNRIRLLLAAPLALGLAACNGSGGDDASGADLTGDPIAAIDAPDENGWLAQGEITEEGGMLLGNPDAPLKLVEYASHVCGACANFSVNYAPALIENYVSTGVVSYEIRSLVANPLDLSIALLARCGTPEGAVPLADQAWANLEGFYSTLQQNGAAASAIQSLPEDQRLIGIADAAGLFEFFAARGISRDQGAQCLSDMDAAEELDATVRASANELNVTGTPTFFLNGSRLEGGWPQIEVALQNAGAR